MKDKLYFIKCISGSWNFRTGKRIMEKARELQKTSISALLTMPKPLTVWITINCGKF